MEFLTEEVIKEKGFTEDQVSFITQSAGDHIAELKKGWDDKANTNAEGILTGAVNYAVSKTGVKLERDQGEKWGDYLARLTDSSLTNGKTALDEKQKELDEKLKNFKGGEEYKLQIDNLTAEKDELLKKYANFDEINSTAEKYTPLEEKYNNMKIEVAFGSIKPSFPAEANEYEVSAKWQEFKNSILKDYNIEFVDNKAIAVSKENIHNQKDLKTLLEGNENIKELLKGRQQGGLGVKTDGEVISVEGVPFPIKKGADSKERAKAIRDYLTKEGLNPATPEYSTKFAELNTKLLKAS